MFLNECQVLLQIIGDSGELHHLVGLFDAESIYLAQAHELGQSTEHRFYRTLPFAFHKSAFRAVHIGDVPFILRPILCDTELFLLGTFAQTPFAYRASCAIKFSGAVFFFCLQFRIGESSKWEIRLGQIKMGMYYPLYLEYKEHMFFITTSDLIRLRRISTN